MKSLLRLFEILQSDLGAVVILHIGVAQLLLEGLAEFGEIFLAQNRAFFLLGGGQLTGLGDFRQLVDAGEIFLFHIR